MKIFEAGKVAVKGADAGSVLKGKRGEVGIGHHVSAFPRFRAGRR
ncbi:MULTISPECIES: hypothetical protein [Actinomyces]|nr:MULTISPECIES: hypothetical protein [Actinomyces]